MVAVGVGGRRAGDGVAVGEIVVIVGLGRVELAVALGCGDGVAVGVDLILAC